MIFNPVIVRHRKLIFSVLNFFLKNYSRQNGFKLLDIIAIYILHYSDFSQKIDLN